MTMMGTVGPTTAAATSVAETSLAATFRLWRDHVTPAARNSPSSPASRFGRVTAPSGQVVAALARVLQLTPAERDHLYGLAGLQPPADRVIGDHIPPGVRRLLARLGDVAVAVFAAGWRMVWSMCGRTRARPRSSLLGDPAGVAPEDHSLVAARFPTPGRRGRVGAWPVRVGNLGASNRAIVAEFRRASATPTPPA